MRIWVNTPNPEVMRENSAIALFIAVFIKPDTDNYSFPNY